MHVSKYLMWYFFVFIGLTSKDLNSASMFHALVRTCWLTCRVMSGSVCGLKHLTFLAGHHQHERVGNRFIVSVGWSVISSTSLPSSPFRHSLPCSLQASILSITHGFLSASHSIIMNPAKRYHFLQKKRFVERKTKKLLPKLYITSSGAVYRWEMATGNKPRGTRILYTIETWWVLSGPSI